MQSETLFSSSVSPLAQIFVALLAQQVGMEKVDLPAWKESVGQGGADAVEMDETLPVVVAGILVEQDGG